MLAGCISTDREVVVGDKRLYTLPQTSGEANMVAAASMAAATIMEVVAANRGRS